MQLQPMQQTERQRADLMEVTVLVNVSTHDLIKPSGDQSSEICCTTFAFCALCSRLLHDSLIIISDRLKRCWNTTSYKVWSQFRQYD